MIYITILISSSIVEVLCFVILMLGKLIKHISSQICFCSHLPLWKLMLLHTIKQLN